MSVGCVEASNNIFSLCYFGAPRFLRVVSTVLRSKSMILERFRQNKKRFWERDRVKIVSLTAERRGVS